MKQYLFIVAFLIGFNCFGQDTTRSFSRSSISIYAGADENNKFYNVVSYSRTMGFSDKAVS